MTLILFKLSTCRFQLSLSVSKVYVLNSHLSVRALPVHKKKKKSITAKYINIEQRTKTRKNIT